MYHNDDFTPRPQSPDEPYTPAGDAWSAPREAGPAPTPEQPLYHSSDGGSFTVRPADGAAPAYHAPAADASTYHAPAPAPAYHAPASGGRRGPTWGKIIALCLVCTLTAGCLGGALGALLAGGGEDDAPAATSPVVTAQAVVPTGGAAAAGSYEALYASCNPACVAISVEGTSGVNIFGQVSRYASAGSGFLISADGYIVTNHHVIAGSDHIEILFSDGATHAAELVGSDEAADIALLKIEGENFPFLAFSDSDALHVGQTVVAIGNPLGELANTMTTGIISALDREINIDGTVMNVLQTNTAVSPGNSGCPLLNMDGHVVGVINSKSGDVSAEGIGFAIPGNDAQKVIQDIMEYGYVRGRAALGITVNTRYNSTYARYYNLPEGAYVEEVTAGSCAEKAGLQANDIITKLGSRTVAGYDDLRAALQKYAAGETAEIVVSRSGKELTLSVTFDERAADPTADASQQSGQGGAGRPQLPEETPEEDDGDDGEQPFRYPWQQEN